MHGAKGIRKLRPLKLLPNKVGRTFNDRLITKTVTSSLRLLGWDSFDIWINDQKARNYLPFSGEKKLIYDITDDWTKLPQTETQRRTTTEDDAAMLEIIRPCNSLFAPTLRKQTREVPGSYFDR